MKADKGNSYGYNKRLQPFANKLRKEMTKAEAVPLWRGLGEVYGNMFYGPDK
jgi:very-short-patch-repair endonuclease